MLPALYPFGSKERWMEIVPVLFGDADHETISSLLDRNLIPVMRGPEIAIYLGISPKLVTHMIKKPHRYYRSFQIQKKNGQPRAITAPRVFLKTVQRYILDCILSQLEPHAAACGFRRGFNCESGATRHVGRPYLWNIDIADFFPSILKASVTRVFRDAGYPEAASFFLSGLCCLDRRLPQGAPTSPALANSVNISMDKALADLAAANGLAYTRYADDLSFSSHELVSTDFRRRVIEIVNQVGFQLQGRKTRLMGPKARREVTGLTVNQQCLSLACSDENSALTFTM